MRAVHQSAVRNAWNVLLAFLLLCGSALASDREMISPVSGEELLPWSSRPAIYMAVTPMPPPVHQFWDRQNAWLFAGVGVMRTLDYTSTLNMQARGREEILLPDDVVNNRAGFAMLEVAATATSIGISYALHRTGHHKLERWLSIGHIGVAGFGAARNYALDSKHPQ